MRHRLENENRDVSFSRLPGNFFFSALIRVSSKFDPSEDNKNNLIENNARHFLSWQENSSVKRVFENRWFSSFVLPFLQINDFLLLSHTCHYLLFLRALLDPSDLPVVRPLRDRDGEPLNLVNQSIEVSRPKKPEDGDRYCTRLAGIGGGVRVRRMKFTPDGTMLVTLDTNGIIKIWDVESSLELCTIDGSCVENMSLSPDGTKLITTSHWGPHKVWDIPSGTGLHALQRAQCFSSIGNFSSDGTRYAALSGPCIYIWDVASGDLVTTLVYSQPGEAETVVFSQDGAKLAVALSSRRGGFVILDVTSGKCLLSLMKPHLERLYEIYEIKFSPDGKTVATTSWNSPGVVTLCDIASGSIVQTLAGPRINIRYIAFSPDGATLRTISEDRSINIWDVASGSVVRTTRSCHADDVLSAFSSDDKKMATVSKDGDIKIWDVESKKLIYTILAKNEKKDRQDLSYFFTSSPIAPAVFVKNKSPSYGIQ